MVAYRALRKGIMDYERRQVYRGPEAYVDLPADPTELDARIAEALADHPDNDELRAAVVARSQPRRRWSRCCRAARSSPSPATA